MKGENLTNWMRGGGILVSVLLMGLSSCKCPSSSDSPGGGGAKSVAGEISWGDPIGSKMPFNSKGQIFVLSLNALAGKKDSDEAVSGLKKGAHSSANSYTLDPTIQKNIQKWEPGGIYISAENLKALKKEVNASGRGSLKDPLKKLITMLKRSDVVSIEPLIVTQEGGQFQRLLTAWIDESETDVKKRWKKSDLGTQLGLDGFPVLVGTSHPGTQHAPDGTPYTWGLAMQSALPPAAGEKINAVGKVLNQIYALGFSLNYWLVGGTLRGPNNDPHRGSGSTHVQTAANVLGYKASHHGEPEKLFPQAMKDWRKGNTVTLIGDFPGKSFTEIAKNIPGGGNFRDEMKWGSLNWTYFKAQAVESSSDPPKGVHSDGNNGASRLHHYSEAIKEGVDIVGLSQDKLHNLTPDPLDRPWKSRELIDALRKEMKFGEGVVMVGDRTGLIRDQHPAWTSGNNYYGIGREMSTVVQLNAAGVKESLNAGADLFHLWRIDTTVPQGDKSKKIDAEPETALKTIETTLSDASLKSRLEKSRKRVLDMKKKRNYRT